MDSAANLVKESADNLAKSADKVDNTLRLWVSSFSEVVSLVQSLNVDVKTPVEQQVEKNSEKKEGYKEESHGVKEEKPIEVKFANENAGEFDPVEEINGGILYDDDYAGLTEITKPKSNSDSINKLGSAAIKTDNGEYVWDDNSKKWVQIKQYTAPDVSAIASGMKNQVEAKKNEAKSNAPKVYTQEDNKALSNLSKSLEDFSSTVKKSQTESATKSQATPSQEVSKIDDKLTTLMEEFDDLLEEDEFFGDGYAKGTTHAKGGMSLVNDGPGNKPEMIVTDRGILIPLAPGDGVIPGDLTENLMKLAKSGGLPMQMPDIKMPDINTNQVINSNATIHFDTLIRVDGNLDEKVLPSIEEIAKGLTNNKNFKQSIYNFTSKEMAKDMRKAGY